MKRAVVVALSGRIDMETFDAIAGLATEEQLSLIEALPPSNRKEGLAWFVREHLGR